jgi:hypothetical protein
MNARLPDGVTRDAVDPGLLSALDQTASAVEPAEQHEPIATGITGPVLDALIKGMAPAIRSLVQRAVSDAVKPLHQHIQELEQRINRRGMERAVDAISEAASALQQRARGRNGS